MPLDVSASQGSITFYQLDDKGLLPLRLLHNECAAANGELGSPGIR